MPGACLLLRIYAHPLMSIQDEYRQTGVAANDT
jgi:hypothetical protein